jgi:hypothetical protein
MLEIKNVFYIIACKIMCVNECFNNIRKCSKLLNLQFVPIFGFSSINVPSKKAFKIDFLLKL